jgi:lipoyl(octanoyl) transferase
VLASDRGGLTTYHGPGQLVLWPVLDLKSPLHANFAVRSYARLLEDTTRAFLARCFGIDTHLVEDEPGVWAGRRGEGPERKIAAMGIYLRRHVAGLGVAVNVDLPVAGDESVNPWARFVPCGLEGKSVASIASEQGPRWRRDGPETPAAMQRHAEAWAREFASRLGLDSVVSVNRSVSGH